MNKFYLWVVEVWSCLSWILKEIYKAFKERMVDLKFDDIPWHPDDYIAYAERWNGRAAMVGIIVLLQLELLNKMSVLEFLGVLQSH
jgi:hypothetical protein